MYTAAACGCMGALETRIKGYLNTWYLVHNVGCNRPDCVPIAMT